MVSAGAEARAVTRCDALGLPPFSDTADGLYRGYLTPGFARTQEQVGAWMVEAGMTARLDAAANLVGRYEGTEPDAPVLMIGSHLDSVRDAGRYDGPLGVMLGIECVAALRVAGRRMRFPIEVIAFGDEEGSRFPAAMLTSRAVAGTLDPAALDVADAEGVTLAEALMHHRHASGRWHLPDASASAANEATTAFAGVTAFGQAARAPGSVLAYLEAHIEQGPALEAEGLALGIVTGIAAQLRYAVSLTGAAGHAGTTAMTLRRDALAAAAEAVLAVERIARDAGGEVVATVGKLDVGPGVANVIPGRANFSLDVRAPDDATRDGVAETVLAEIAAIADRRGIDLAIERVHDLPASPCDPALVDLLARAVTATGQPVRRLASGAGHDAMAMAALCPTAMLFIRCKGGISHNPAESVDPNDVELAARAMLRFIELMEETVA
ncbi:Zn-dependent hydrolase [uncultured Sphingomonas sp.]|uniref:Zn-dependent hydrolase n=1 Tax=uncultured Sphingomonas sp. TaxID=158754 RepID=UPI0035CBE621